MAVYQSEFQGATIDARLAAVATMQTAISNLESAVAAKYSKPSSGIPETDLAANVQSALALARTAIQSLSDYYTKAQVDDITAAIAASVDSTSGVVVTTLPSAGAGTLGKIYYVGPDANGFYDRYVTSYDGSTYSWLALGNTEVDMTQYATVEQLNQLDQEINGLNYDKTFAVSGYGYPTYDTVRLLAGVSYQIKLTVSNPTGSGTIYFRLASNGTALKEKGVASPFAVTTVDYTPEQDVDADIQFATGNSCSCKVEITSEAVVAKRAELVALNMEKSACLGIRRIFSINNAATSESIDITGLPAGTYKIQLIFAGATPPAAINIYGTSGDKTGIISTYADKANKVWFDFVKTDSINYIWCFKADSYTYDLTLVLFAEGITKDLYADSQKNSLPFKYKFDNNLFYVSTHSENRDLVVGLGPGGGNGLFDFRKFGYLPYDSDLNVSSITQLHSSDSDWFSPFQIGAVENVDGDDPTSYNFTGGSHQYNNAISGSTPTARLANLKIEVDGKVVSSGAGAGRFVRMSWSNYVQGYNTRKANGSGREILREDIVMTFDGEEWQARTTLVPLEDVIFRLFYGYQITGISSGLATTWRFVGASNREQDASESGNATACAVIADGATHIEMWLDTAVDLGKRELCYSGLTKAVFKSGNKSYFTIFNNPNNIAAAGDMYDVVGRYIIKLNP